MDIRDLPYFGNPIYIPPLEQLVAPGCTNEILERHTIIAVLRTMTLQRINLTIPRYHQIPYTRLEFAPPVRIEPFWARHVSVQVEPKDAGLWLGRIVFLDRNRRAVWVTPNGVDSNLDLVSAVQAIRQWLHVGRTAAEVTFRAITGTPQGVRSFSRCPIDRYVPPTL